MNSKSDAGYSERNAKNNADDSNIPRVFKC